jgi:HEPN domain-containing protein
MKPDEARLLDTKAWAAKASSDLRSARHAMSAEPPLCEDALFHCQQAVEKLFKAVLTWHDVPFRKTHSLEELGRQCAELEPALGTLVDEAAPLSEYAWRYRYPGPETAPSIEQAQEALRVAESALPAILALLPSQVQTQPGP